MQWEEIEAPPTCPGVILLQRNVPDKNADWEENPQNEYKIKSIPISQSGDDASIMLRQQLHMRGVIPLKRTALLKPGTHKVDLTQDAFETACTAIEQQLHRPAMLYVLDFSNTCFRSVTLFSSQMVAKFDFLGALQALAEQLRGRIVALAKEALVHLSCLFDTVFDYFAVDHHELMGYDNPPLLQAESNSSSGQMTKGSLEALTLINTVFSSSLHANSLATSTSDSTTHASRAEAEEKEKDVTDSDDDDDLLSDDDDDSANEEIREEDFIYERPRISFFGNDTAGTPVPSLIPKEYYQKGQFTSAVHKALKYKFVKSYHILLKNQDQMLVGVSIPIDEAKKKCPFLLQSWIKVFREEKNNFIHD